jgi:menaquinone-dependent protoporphyrinogen oxidase
MPRPCRLTETARHPACPQPAEPNVSALNVPAPDAPTPVKAAALFYATRDGQARRVAERIEARLAAWDCRVPSENLATVPMASALAVRDLLIVVAAVRYGRHLPEAERLLTACGALRVPPPLALVSVNLTARKPGAQTVEGNRYLRATIARHRLAPVIATAVAGRLDYPRYSWLDRQVIRCIMAVTGGPTDPRAQVEFTDWPAVDGIADQIAVRLVGAGQRPANQSD